MKKAIIALAIVLGLSLVTPLLSTTYADSHGEQPAPEQPAPDQPKPDQG